MASESEGMSGCFSAHRTIAARISEPCRSVRFSLQTDLLTNVLGHLDTACYSTDRKPNETGLSGTRTNSEIRYRANFKTGAFNHSATPLALDIASRLQRPFGQRINPNLLFFGDG